MAPFEEKSSLKPQFQYQKSIKYEYLNKNFIFYCVTYLISGCNLKLNLEIETTHMITYIAKLTYIIP